MIGQNFYDHRAVMLFDRSHVADLRTILNQSSVQRIHICSGKPNRNRNEPCDFCHPHTRTLPNSPNPKGTTSTIKYVCFTRLRSRRACVSRFNSHAHDHSHMNTCDHTSSNLLTSSCYLMPHTIADDPIKTIE